MAVSQRLRQASNVALNILVPLMCQNFLFFVFVFVLFFQKKLVIFRLYDRKRLLVTLPIVTPYTHEQIFSLLPTIVLHYIFLSILSECGDVSITCMLSFSYEDSVNVYSFVARVAYRLAQALYLDVHADIHIGIFILTLLQIYYL